MSQAGWIFTGLVTHGDRGQQFAGRRGGEGKQRCWKNLCLEANAKAGRGNSSVSAKLLQTAFLD